MEGRLCWLNYSTFLSMSYYLSSICNFSCLYTTKIESTRWLYYICNMIIICIVISATDTEVTKFRIILQVWCQFTLNLQNNSKLCNFGIFYYTTHIMWLRWKWGSYNNNKDYIWIQRKEHLAVMVQRVDDKNPRRLNSNKKTTQKCNL